MNLDFLKAEHVLMAREHHNRLVVQLNCLLVMPAQREKKRLTYSRDKEMGGKEFFWVIHIQNIS